MVEAKIIINILRWRSDISTMVPDRERLRRNKKETIGQCCVKLKTVVYSIQVRIAYQSI